MSIVANTIREQIGHKAFFMLGAKDLVASENALQFRIRGSRVCNSIRVELDPSDTYRVEFWKIHAGKSTKVAEVEDVYVDSLHQVIERNTGLYTSL